MRTSVLTVLALVCAAFLLSGCGEEAAAQCSCEEGKAGGTVWCEKCSKGYVKGKATKCEGCVEAANSGGECEACAKKKK